MPSSTKSISSATDSNTVTVTFDYVETFKVCLEDAASFLRLAGTEPKPVLAAVLNAFEEKVGAFPLSCPISPQLLVLGISKYREYLYKGYRIFYSFDEKDSVVSAYVLLSQKQDIQALIFLRLIHP